MSGIGAGYDLSVTTFSQEGRIFQVEYASKAVETRGTMLSMRLDDSILIATEKPTLSKMAISSSRRRVYRISSHIMMGVSGILADGRAIVEWAREETSRFKDNYDRDIPVFVLAERVGNFMHAYTTHPSVRPFGTTICLCGVTKDVQSARASRAAKKPDNGRPELFQITPSGDVNRMHAMAVGKGRQVARVELEKLLPPHNRDAFTIEMDAQRRQVEAARDTEEEGEEEAAAEKHLDNMTLDIAAKEAVRILYLARDASETEMGEIEICGIGVGMIPTFIPAEKIKNLLEEVKKEEEEESSDDDEETDEAELGESSETE
ncbi:hypothetical protein ADUPG1_009608 [Aduncisulcus paluster]|uniref:Proteasome alpha-type subunits domain-containing protein n=1 Tax=Aduncisulcus paluster TaxID=2918883 RepID=A0ABQ5KW59_9EUKA|nr:hypothetical protein ADUPG1_009609 [Aduncisulcus paluster]GKT36696.1 hypothetical protein ADUPG1_009608 [Aduncisulcus paluster]